MNSYNVSFVIHYWLTALDFQAGAIVISSYFMCRGLMVCHTLCSLHYMCEGYTHLDLHVVLSRYTVEESQA